MRDRHCALCTTLSPPPAAWTSHGQPRSSGRCLAAPTDTPPQPAPPHDLSPPHRMMLTCSAPPAAPPPIHASTPPSCGQLVTTGCHRAGGLGAPRRTGRGSSPAHFPWRKKGAGHPAGAPRSARASRRPLLYTPPAVCPRRPASVVRAAARRRACRSGVWIAGGGVRDWTGGCRTLSPAEATHQMARVLLGAEASPEAARACASRPRLAHQRWRIARSRDLFNGRVPLRCPPRPLKIQFCPLGHAFN